MPAVSHPSLLQIVTFIFFIFNSQFTYSYASAEDESTINKLFETHGKDNVVNFILHNNNRKITIQKKKSFLSVTGRPDIDLITAKSVNHDLGSLNIAIGNLRSELDAYLEIESKKKQKKEASLSRSASVGGNDEILPSRKLEHKIKKLHAKINTADSEYERRRLSKELSKLQKKYNDAKYDEKYQPKIDSAEQSSEDTKSNSSEDREIYYCNRAKSQLQKMTEPAYRHQIFFCNDRSYRKMNPGSCGKYRYSKQYTLPEYKDEIRRLRLDVSDRCKS